MLGDGEGEGGDDEGDLSWRSIESHFQPTPTRAVSHLISFSFLFLIWFILTTYFPTPCAIYPSIIYLPAVMSCNILINRVCPVFSCLFLSTLNSSSLAVLHFLLCSLIHLLFLHLIWFVFSHLLSSCLVLLLIFFLYFYNCRTHFRDWNHSVNFCFSSLCRCDAMLQSVYQIR